MPTIPLERDLLAYVITVVKTENCEIAIKNFLQLLLIITIIPKIIIRQGFVRVIITSYSDPYV